MKATPIFLTITALGVGLACGAAGTTEAKGRPTDLTAAAPEVTQNAELPSVTSAAPSLAPLVKALAPAVVNLEVVKETHLSQNNPLHQFLGDMPQQQQGAGSGFIISADGYVLTNNHVIADATDVVVRFADESTAKGKVIGTDPRTDVALVKIQDDKTYPFVSLGSSTALEVGDWVMAIGNPFGMNNTVTAGIVSAKGRQIGDGVYEDFIQTDASINPGNSGGPLFNLKGEVVGINTAINAYGQGIAYAVPVDLVKDRIEELKTSGTIARGFLGVNLQPADKALLASLSIPPETTGALINRVEDGLPADKAGIQPGDFVFDIDGKPIKNVDDLQMRIGQYRPGDSVALTFYRNGSKKDLKVKLGERPPENEMADGSEPEGGGQDKNKSEEPEETKGGVLGTLGIQVTELSMLRNRGIQIPDDLHGVVVTGVEPGGTAAGKLREKDVIVSVNGTDISTGAELKSALKRGSDPALLVVVRNGNRAYVGLPLHAEE